MGLHNMFIGTTNYTISKIFQVENNITYPLFLSIILAIIFIIMEYPIIIYLKKSLPFMLGKNIILKNQK